MAESRRGKRGAAAADARAGSAASCRPNPKPGTRNPRKPTRAGPPASAPRAENARGNPARANRQLQTAQTPPGRKRAGHRPRHRRWRNRGARGSAGKLQPLSPILRRRRRRRRLAVVALVLAVLVALGAYTGTLTAISLVAGDAADSAMLYLQRGRRLAGFHRYRNPHPGRNASRRLCRNGRRGCRGVFGLWQ